jgi:hypothetical protein
MIVSLVALAYVFGTLGVLQLQAAIIREDPSAMPRGGRAALVAIAVLWPLVLALCVLGLIVYGVSDL